MLSGDLTNAQFALFNELERIGAAFSLTGTAFVLVTFLSSDEFQKPINRLVFYACLGNVMMSIASLIAREAIDAVLKTGNGNYNTFFCQFQAVLVQMFLPADALWTFVMALNVYLTFFRKFDAISLRALEKWYFLACYGIPFGPAFIDLFIHTKIRPHIYGDATLWCWISEPWRDLRIITFYGPVWVVICATVFIYIYAGKEIYNKTKMLRDFHKAGLGDSCDMPSNPFNAVFVNTHIETYSGPKVDLDTLTPTGRRSTAGPPDGSSPNCSAKVTITVGDPESPDERPVEQYDGNVNSFSYDGSYHEKPFESRPLPALPTSPTSPTPAYAPNTPISGRRPSINPSGNMVATTAMLAYTKVAVLFFLAMMMTWIPSSANRVYSVIYPKDVSLVLESFSAFVLPLQGFWNAVIYAATSIDACKNLWYHLKTHKRFSSSGIRNIIRGFPTEGELQASNQVQVPNSNRRSDIPDNDNESQARLNRKDSRPQTGKSRFGTADSEDQQAIINQVNSREDSRVTSHGASDEYTFEEYPRIATPPTAYSRNYHHEDAHQPTNRVHPTSQQANAYARALYSRETGRELHRDSSCESFPDDYSRRSFSNV